MILVVLRVEPPLDPTPDQARDALRRELLGADYHRDNLLSRALDWLSRHLSGGPGSGTAPSSPLSTLVLIAVILLLVLGIGLLASRARFTARRREETGAVLTDEQISAADLRRRAEEALAEGRLEDAVVDGFRALTLRQVERGRLDDTPGATAHEVAVAVASTYPSQGGRVGASAQVFDAVLYGDRPATRDQATEVLVLDEDLAGLPATTGSTGFRR